MAHGEENKSIVTSRLRISLYARKGSAADVYVYMCIVPLLDDHSPPRIEYSLLNFIHILMHILLKTARRTS